MSSTHGGKAEMCRADKLRECSMAKKSSAESPSESHEPDTRPQEPETERDQEPGQPEDDEPLVEEEREPYRPCMRCGLRPVESKWMCSVCHVEVDFCNGRPTPNGVKRRCPVCRSRDEMGHAPNFRAAPRHVCDCGAEFDVRTARLSFPGCTRTGKGVIGTNIKARNDARTILFGPKPSKQQILELEQEWEQAATLEREKREQAASERWMKRQEELRLAAEGDRLTAHYRRHGEIPMDATPTAVAQALIRCGDRGFRKKLWKILYEGAHVAELQSVAESKCLYQTIARAAVAKLREADDGDQQGR